jgi:hypothetical protein
MGGADLIVLNLFGIVGIGIVWGWYLGAFIGHMHTPLNTVPALVAASLVVSACILWYSGITGLVLLMVSALAALIIRVLWHRELQMRYGPFKVHIMGVE